MRLKALRSLNILDTPTEREFDDLTHLASIICNAPIALVSLIDAERQWFKSKVGLEVCETSRDLAFCAHAILKEDLFIVADARKDSRFAENPLVTGAPHIQFYAGAPLITDDGHALGTLCVIDRRPRRLTPKQKEALAALARQAVAHFNLRRQTALLAHSHDVLRQSEEKYRVVAESASDVIITTDERSRILFVNPAAEKVLGYTPEELIGSNLLMMIPERFRAAQIEGIQNYLQTGERRISWSGTELAAMRKGGEEIDVEVSFGEHNERDKRTFTVVIRDITERKRVEEKLVHNALHDELTNLPNRALFLEHLARAVKRNNKRGKKHFAVLFLDFDHFKVINDSLGHMEGDKLLKQIARRLENALRTGDVVARLGGDEFAVLLDDLSAPEDALHIVERIYEKLKTPFDLSGREIFITASIGITLSNESYKKPLEMLRDADIAMYRAKEGGKARYRTFDPVMHEQADRRLQMEIELRNAIDNKEFRLHYQPIINLQTGKIVCFEALVRWSQPERGIVSPAEFIPLAEETGLILPLGDWILRESCRQLREWRQSIPAAADRLSISVNLSPKQFAQPDLVERVTAVLSENGIAPDCLKLEITESHLMETSEAVTVMINRLRSLGIELSLDDFGTGYSSLSYLHRLPVNYLKVDRSFVSRMTESEENHEIVRTIIKLAQNLKMKVVAEGIETEEQLAQLKKLGCDHGQGYLFSKPLPAETASVLIGNAENLQD